MAEVIDLTIPPRLEFVGVVRLALAAAAQGVARFDERRTFDLRVVASETATNAIQAQHRRGCREPVRIRCALAEDMVEIIVVDHGGGFAPERIPSLPPPDDPRRLDHESGLGLTLVRALSDRVDIEPADEGTVVRAVLRAQT